MKNMDNSKPHASKNVLIIGAIFAVLVLGIGVFILNGIMNQPTMTQAEQEQAMAELAE